MCCPNTLQWQCRLYVYVFWMYGMVLLALDEQQVRSYWSCHPCSMWCEVVISTWCMCCSNNYNGDDNCTLCSWHVWNGVVLTLDEQRVRLYWCVFEFESVICVRNSMSSWSHSDVMCKYTTMVTATLCLYTTGGAFVLVCVWIWPSDSSSIQYEAVIWLTQMCVNTIQCRWRSHLLCPWWWMYVYVWNGTVSPRWPWTKRRCVCTGVLVDRCVFDFEGVIRVRYTIQYEVVISPWCTVQIHCNNGNDGCVSTPVERMERCRVDPGLIGCTFVSVSCIEVCLNLKLVFMLDTYDVVISPWCDVQIHYNVNDDCVCMCLNVRNVVMLTLDE